MLHCTKVSTIVVLALTVLTSSVRQGHDEDDRRVEPTPAPTSANSSEAGKEADKKDESVEAAKTDKQEEDGKSDEKEADEKTDKKDEVVDLSSPQKVLVKDAVAKEGGWKARGTVRMCMDVLNDGLKLTVKCGTVGLHVETIFDPNTQLCDGEATGHCECQYAQLGKELCVATIAMSPYVPEDATVHLAASEEALPDCSLPDLAHLDSTQPVKAAPHCEGDLKAEFEYYVLTYSQDMSCDADGAPYHAADYDMGKHLNDHINEIVPFAKSIPDQFLDVANSELISQNVGEQVLSQGLRTPGYHIVLRSSNSAGAKLSVQCLQIATPAFSISDAKDEEVVQPWPDMTVEQLDKASKDATAPNGTVRWKESSTLRVWLSTNARVDGFKLTLPKKVAVASECNPTVHYRGSFFKTTDAMSVAPDEKEWTANCKRDGAAVDIKLNKELASGFTLAVDIPVTGKRGTHEDIFYLQPIYKDAVVGQKMAAVPPYVAPPEEKKKTNGEEDGNESKSAAALPTRLTAAVQSVYMGVVVLSLTVL